MEPVAGKKLAPIEIVKSRRLWCGDEMRNETAVQSTEVGFSGE